MLELTIPPQEFYNSAENRFYYTDERLVRLEHSLISVSKWEAIWKKAFLPGPSSPGISGRAEELSYISCMIVGKIEPSLLPLLHRSFGEEIRDYISDKHTATTIHRIGPQQPNRQTITSELIYYWMIKFGIPFDCEKWHLNRLLTLIDVCSTKEAAEHGNKMTSVDSARYRHELNKARRKSS